MRRLSSEETRRITRAVKTAESGTAGEIVTAVIPESDDYAGRELLFGIAVAVVVQVILVLVTSPLERFLDSLLWTESRVILPLTMMSSSLLAGAMAYALAQVPAVDRVVVGRRIMAEAVRRRALRHFVESAAYDTVDRTGVLLFISVLERRVELIADKGINDKVEAGVWEGILAGLIRDIRENRTAEGIEAAVVKVGGILAEHVPPRPDDINEIPDGPTNLEKGS